MTTHNWQDQGTPNVVEISFKVADEHAPAFRAAVEEMKNEIGGRLMGQHRFPKEAALTNASIAVSALLAATVKKVAQPDPNYD